MARIPGDASARVWSCHSPEGPMPYTLQSLGWGGDGEEMVGETMVLPGRVEGRPRRLAMQAGRQVDGLWSRACEHIAGGPRAVLGRNGTFEGGLQAEARLRRVVGRCGTAQQLMGQSDLAFAFDEAGWQVPAP